MKRTARPAVPPARQARPAPPPPPPPPPLVPLVCRRPFLPYSTFLFFPLLYGTALGAGGRYPYAPAVDMQRAVLLNNATVVNARCAPPRRAAPRGGRTVLWRGAVQRSPACRQLVALC